MHHHLIVLVMWRSFSKNPLEIRSPQPTQQNCYFWSCGKLLYFLANGIFLHWKEKFWHEFSKQPQKILSSKWSAQPLRHRQLWIPLPKLSKATINLFHIIFHWPQKNCQSRNEFVGKLLFVWPARSHSKDDLITASVDVPPFILTSIKLSLSLFIKILSLRC